MRRFAKGKGAALRAHMALKSRANDDRPIEVLWPIGEVKNLSVTDACEADHIWDEASIFQDDLVLVGCRNCPSVKRLPPAPDPSDHEALRHWLDA